MIMKTTKSFFKFAFVLIFVFQFFSVMKVNSQALQEVKMSMQGILKNFDGTIVNNGYYDVTFKLYTVPAGGTAIWSEDQTIMTNGGVYNTVLGKTSAGLTALQNLSYSTTYYLGITISGTQEMNPRMELTGGPMAIRAKLADEATHALDATHADSADHALNANHSIHADSATHAANATNANTANVALALSTTGSQSFANDIWHFSNDGNGRFYFGSSTKFKSPVGEFTFLDNAENVHLVLKDSGNVGIGVTDPQANLEIAGELRVRLSSSFPLMNVSRIVDLGFSGMTGARNWALRGVYQYGGGVGINAEGGDLDLIKSFDGNTILATKTDGSALGYVGIGTTSPGAKLDLGNTGDIKFGDRGGYAMWKISSPNAGTNYPNTGAKTGTLVHISWNGGNGYALLLVTAGTVLNEAPIVIASSSGGANSFDTANNYASGSDGIGVFSNGGNLYVQTKNNYSGGDIYVTIIGCGANN